MRLPPTLAPLRHPDFRRLLAAHALSRFGTELALVAVAFAVLQSVPSAGALGLVLAARTLPNVVFLVFGGVWADRLPRARVMISSDLVCAIVQGTLATAVLTGHATVWLIVVLQAMLGAASAFFPPAATGLTPVTVPGSDLQRANGLLGLVSNAAGMLGPAVSGVLVAAAAPGWALLMDAATFLLSASLLLALRHRSHVEPKVGGLPRRVGRELAEGWHEVSSRPWLVAGIAQGLLFQACFAGFFTLGPVIARSSLGGADAWGVLVTAFGVGSLIGSMLSLRLRLARPLVAMQVALLVCAPAMAALSGIGWLPALMAATALAGAGFAAADAFWETTLQREIPQDRLGRVAAFDRIGSSCLRPFGYLIAGSAAAAAGQHATLRGASLLLALSVPVVVLLVPQVRRLRNRPDTTVDGSEPLETAATGS
ncbi:MFS transporter [Streptomyces sp. NBC_00201]|uniref:MFS transporter n=1 Tax=Streptomyces sp. NBC_00201 TaxID=2975679 RepID=UPI002259D4C8|nr:MFS transporter [Streptomyces sp. NBC_00201]MCX5247143.1 MFS transporter [Streptomyces sp. NBC_00201]